MRIETGPISQPGHEIIMQVHAPHTVPTHLPAEEFNPAPTASQQDQGVPILQGGFVVRGSEGVFDTLGWEGYDDTRYLATLQAALAEAKAAGKHAQLVARAERWLDNLSVHADLDEWRMEMAQRTEALLKR